MNISVDHDGHLKESVTDADGESKEWKEIAVVGKKMINKDTVDDLDAIADAEDTVEHHHPVQRCFAGFLQDEIDQNTVGQVDQDQGNPRQDVNKDIFSSWESVFNCRNKYFFKRCIT